MTSSIDILSLNQEESRLCRANPWRTNFKGEKFPSNSFSLVRERALWFLLSDKPCSSICVVTTHLQTVGRAGEMWAFVVYCNLGCFQEAGGGTKIHYSVSVLGPPLVVGKVNPLPLTS